MFQGPRDCSTRLTKFNPLSGSLLAVIFPWDRADRKRHWPKRTETHWPKPVKDRDSYEKNDREPGTLFEPLMRLRIHLEADPRVRREPSRLAGTPEGLAPYRRSGGGDETEP